MPAKLGLDCKLYYKTGGQASASAWTLLGNTKDVTLTVEAGDADVTTRANNGWKASLATLKSGNIEFEMIYDTSDDGFTAIRTAYFTNAALGLRVLDGLIPTSGTNGTQGLSCDAMITNMEFGQPLEEAVTVKITAKPAYSATPPAWVTL